MSISRKIRRANKVRPFKGRNENVEGKSISNEISNLELMTNLTSYLTIVLSSQTLNDIGKINTYFRNNKPIPEDYLVFDISENEYWYLYTRKPINFLEYQSLISENDFNDILMGKINLLKSKKVDLSLKNYTTFSFDYFDDNSSVFVGILISEIKLG